MKVINLTQHKATPDQIEVGVVEPKKKHEVAILLTFTELPMSSEIKERAASLAEIAKEENAQYAMIGGAPFLMVELHHALLQRGITPLYAFSKRESIEETLPDGSVKKTQIFKHAGFVTLCNEQECGESA
jgi:hypothetical protein